MGEGVQRQFDLTPRGEQLALLRHLQLPMKEMSVLRVIDDHGQGCWPSQKTIAREAGCKRRSAQAAIKALAAKSLICVERKQPKGRTDRLTANHYTIVWSEVASLVDRQRKNNATPAPAMAAVHLAVAAEETGPIELPPSDRPVAAHHRPRDPRHKPGPDDLIDERSMRKTEHINAHILRPKRPRTDQENSPPYHCAHYQNDGWGAAEKFLRGEGIRAPGRIIQRAKSVGLSPQRLIVVAQRIIATAKLPPNRKLWRTDAIAAAYWRLAYGEWFAEGVIEMEQWEREIDRRKAHDEELALGRLAGDMWKSIHALRRAGLDDLAIARRLAELNWPTSLIDSELPGALHMEANCAE